MIWRARIKYFQLKYICWRCLLKNSVETLYSDRFENADRVLKPCQPGLNPPLHALFNTMKNHSRQMPCQAA